MLRLSPTSSAGIASFLLLPENQAEYVRNQRQAYAAQNGGHAGASRPRSRRSYGSLSESASAVEPEPASESVDDTNEVVSRSSASPSSSAAAALAAARALSAQAFAVFLARQVCLSL
jgi:hypothetical protein